MQLFQNILGQNPRLHAAPLAVELHQLRPLHALARLLAVAGIVGKEGIPAPLAGCDPDARAYVDTQTDTLDGLHGALVEDLDRAGHRHLGIVGVGAVELTALDKTAIYFIKKTHSFSYIFLGVGFIFFSLYCLKLELNESFKHLNYLKYFQLSNPSIILSTLNGILISGIIQSSSATIGLAQIATQNNNISLLSGICIVLGANIGTTFTGLIASIRSSNNSKILAVSNLILNLLGNDTIITTFESQCGHFFNKSIDSSSIHPLPNATVVKYKEP